MRGKAFRIDNFGGGLDYRDGGEFVAEINYHTDEHKRANFLREALNVICDDNNTLRRRRGVVTHANAVRPVNSLFITKSAPSGIAGGEVFLGKDLLVNGGAGVGILAYNSQALVVPPTTITGTLTACNEVIYAEAQQVDGMGPVYALGDQGEIGVGTGVRAQWKGTGSFAAWTAKTPTAPTSGWTYRGTVPFGKYMLYFQSRLIIACDPQEGPGKNTLWWSDTPNQGGPRVWPTHQQLILDPDDGDHITGLAPSAQNLLVFKANRIYSVYDMVDGANRTISTDRGCINGNTIATTPNGTMFLDQNAGVCITDGRTVRTLSDAVAPAIDFFSRTYSLIYAAATYINGHYLLSAAISPVTGLGITLDYDTKHDSWWAHTFFAKQFAVKTSSSRDELFMLPSEFVVGGGEPELRVGGPATMPAEGPLNPGGPQGIFRVFAEGYTTDGSVGTGGAIPPADYTHEIRTRWLDFDAPYLRKRMRRVRATGRGRINVDLRKGYSEASPNVLATAGLGSATTSTDSAVLDMPVSQSVSHAFSIRVSGNADLYWVLNDLTAMATARSD